MRRFFALAAVLLVVVLWVPAWAAGNLPDNIGDLQKGSYVGTDCTQNNCAPGFRTVLVSQSAGTALFPAAGAAADAVVNPTITGLGAYEMGFNGTTWDRKRTASAANVSAASGIGAMLVATPGNWSVTSAPAANTQATVAKGAGGAGVRHVVNCVSASYNATGTAPAAAMRALTIYDGTSAGTVLWVVDVSVQAVAGQTNTISQCGLSLVGSVATAMTVEFSSAGGANTQQTVTLTGYDAG